jgi:cytoskeletal protein RodZ
MTQSGRQTAHSDDKHDSYLQAVESDPDIAISAVAADLVRARTHLGLEIETVAEDLRIRRDHLLAIEGGRYDTLPGPVYVVGFLRSYANYLGLDADDIITRFKAESMGFEVPQKLHFPVVPEAGRLPRVPLLIAALVMAGLGYVGWYYVTSSEGDLASLIPEVPGRLADLVSASDDDATGAPPADVAAPAEPEPATAEPEPAITATAEAVSPAPSATAGTTASDGEPASAGTETVSPDIVTVEPLAAPSAEPEITVADGTQATDPGNGVDSTPDESGAPSETGPAEAIPAVAAEPTVSPGSSTPPEDDGNDAASAEAGETDVAALVVPPPPEVSTDYVPRVFGQANSGSRILVKARLESWVQVTGANNELLITRILRPGDVYHVPDREGLFLMTGNAGGIDLLVDGAIVPSLGPVNAIRRDVALVPDRLASGTAVP